MCPEITRKEWGKTEKFKKYNRTKLQKPWSGKFHKISKIFKLYIDNNLYLLHYYTWILFYVI